MLINLLNYFFIFVKYTATIAAIAVVIAATPIISVEDSVGLGCLGLTVKLRVNPFTFTENENCVLAVYLKVTVVLSPAFKVTSFESSTPPLIFNVIV